MFRRVCFAATIVVAATETTYNFAEVDVQNFVNSIADEAVKNMDSAGLADLQSSGAARILESTEVKNYTDCGICQNVNSQRLNAYFQQKIRESCLVAVRAPASVKQFCRSFAKKVRNLDEELNGYLFQLLRVLQLATAMCIESEKCSPVNAFNTYLTPILPDMLTDVERYCPTVSFGSYQECVDNSSQDILDYAVARVKSACSKAKEKSHDLYHFCAWFSTSERFGYGMVQAMAPNYQYATFLCKQYSDKCQCRLAGGNPLVG